MEGYKDLTFSTFQLFINECLAELKNFNVNDKWNQNFPDENQIIHNVICKIMNERYFTLYDNFGSPNPRPNHIFDIPTKTKIVNPRKNSQAELKNQLFCLYDTNTKILYLNNSHKKSFIYKYLRSILSQEIIIKNIYKNIDEFVNTLKSLDEIKFTAHRDIFSSQINSFKNIKDLFGIDEPESFTISAKYKVSVHENIKRTIEKFKNEQIQAPNSCLTCIGKDEHGFEQIFNENTFSKTISVILAQNEEKLLNPKSVFEELIRKIESNA